MSCGLDSISLRSRTTSLSKMGLPSLIPKAAIGVLSHDPRPSYQRKPGRIYGLNFAGFDIRFRVEEKTLTVCEVIKLPS